MENPNEAQAVSNQPVIDQPTSAPVVDQSQAVASYSPNSVTPIASKKSNRGKVIIFVLLGIILFSCLICGGFFGVVYYLGVQQAKGLTKVQNDKLTFYYPENYKSETADSGQFVYTSPDKNKFGGNSSIRTMDNASLVGYDKVNSTDTCKKFAEGKLDTTTTTTSTSASPNAEQVVYTDFAGLKSCSFNMSYDAKDFGKTGNVIISVKVLIKGSDRTAVVASYDDGTSSDEKDKLMRSVTLFAFK